MESNFQKVAMHGLIKKAGRYLVLHRSPENDWQPDLWDIPGGTVEFGEDHIHALTREILEETGLVVIVGKPLYIYSTLSSPVRHQFQVVYACSSPQGDIRVDPEDHDLFRWVTLKEMSSLPKIAFLEGLYSELLKSV